jgi:hypothetical protein
MVLSERNRRRLTDGLPGWSPDPNRHGNVVEKWLFVGWGN